MTLSTRLFALPLLLILVVPLLVSLVLLAPSFLNLQAFADLFAHPQFPGALWLSLSTGSLATALSLLFAILIVTAQQDRLMGRAGVFLAVPHVAAAIGLGFLLAPTGLLARLFAQAVGLTSPPQWELVQDRHGLSLVAALVLKETPFLVWALASLFTRDDLGQLFRDQISLARSLGRGTLVTWLTVLLPQVLPRISWPLVAVFSYGCTVVDMALVLGPGQPPTLANLIWSDLADSEIAHNLRGAAGVVVLSVAVALLLLILRGLGLLLRHGVALLLNHGLGFNASVPDMIGRFIWRAWLVLYAVLIGFLVVASIAAAWPFPTLVPQAVTAGAWLQLSGNARPVLNSLALATGSSAVALVASIAWLETQPPLHDRLALLACGLMLCLPSLVTGLGQYRLFLLLGITGTASAMFLAHVLPVAAYVFVMLHGPYRSYDVRWQSAASGLMAARWQFLSEIKWPMLKSSLLMATATGFAVSAGQYVAAQLASAGRYTTLPIEAVTLASGGSRPLMACYALALMMLPLLAFAAASWLARPRWTLHA